MRKILISLPVVALLTAAACSTPTAAHDGGCPPGYLMSSGDKCVPEHQIAPAVPLPVLSRHAGTDSIPALHALSCGGCTTIDGKSGYLINAGRTCSPCGGT